MQEYNAFIYLHVCVQIVGYNYVFFYYVNMYDILYNVMRIYDLPTPFQYIDHRQLDISNLLQQINQRHEIHKLTIIRAKFYSQHFLLHGFVHIFC